MPSSSVVKKKQAANAVAAKSQKKKDGVTKNAKAKKVDKGKKRKKSVSEDDDGFQAQDDSSNHEDPDEEEEEEGENEEEEDQGLQEEDDNGDNDDEEAEEIEKAEEEKKAKRVMTEEEKKARFNKSKQRAFLRGIRKRANLAGGLASKRARTCDSARSMERNIITPAEVNRACKLHYSHFAEMPMFKDTDVFKMMHETSKERFSGRARDILRANMEVFARRVMSEGWAIANASGRIRLSPSDMRNSARKMSIPLGYDLFYPHALIRHAQENYGANGETLVLRTDANDVQKGEGIDETIVAEQKEIMQME